LLSGVYDSIEALKELNNRKEHFKPQHDLEKANEGYAGWKKIISKR
jgi:glycerol kinase